MTGKHLKVLKGTASAMAVILILLAAAFLAKAYPAAIVGGSVITKKYWDQVVDIGKKLDPSVSEQAIEDQMIKTKIEQHLALGSGVVPDLQAEFLYETAGKEREYQALLKNYFNSEPELFKEFVSKPQAYDAAWRIRYNAHSDLNKPAMDRAKNILARVKNGESFETLAKTESDDKVTGQLGGDLGFVTQGRLLPELEKALMNAEVGQVDPNIVVSRLGYHILYPVETAEKDGIKSWHVKHILVKTTGFDEWLNSQLNHVWVWRLK